MRSAAVLALLLCAGQVTALPVNSPLNKGDTEVMKCIVEVISDTLSKPSPMPVSQECFETLRGDERILSILRHQNLLKELQDLALQEMMEEAPSAETTEKRADSNEAEESAEVTEARPHSLELGQESTTEAYPQGLPEADTHPHIPAHFSSQRPTGTQAEEDSEGLSQVLVDSEKGLSAGQEQQEKRQEEEEETEAEAREKVVPEDEGPTTTSQPHPSLSYKESQKDEGPSEVLAVDSVVKIGAEEAQSPEGKREREHALQQEVAGRPRAELKRQEGEEEEQLSKEWEDAKRWSKMDQLAKELAAEKRLEGEEDDDPDRSMKLSFQSRAYGFRGPRHQLRRGWRPSSQEDSIEAGLPLQVRSYPEEKKEEEGSANRRPEDQELESLSAIEAELEKVAQQLQALRRG
ncbi:Chromogranin-A [Tupaia chinensis]|uniref:Chromogranin-A n=1 Tax=Tupaia chinensis TaxID=246437 RepID=L9JZY9_TUPCH|nr:Chromogranin-A [Tupaia chinensis]